ncbi:autotransporter outer membrane beta-barrel domain-containing protein [Pseudomonas chlororaphis]|uniref:Pertactin family protein n=1 Tax=Pseudomonas chlororaphis O6 TaxID=1037915 RepID=A0AB33WZW5_9PSED|nr:autotransporter outer membrane beta-barrel domain-containing protein [Pseudomonas chlororaphis]EIM18773.1 pertactin family protein [Pseudomonas chlororaphis O6]
METFGDNAAGLRIAAGKQAVDVIDSAISSDLASGLVVEGDGAVRLSEDSTLRGGNGVAVMVKQGGQLELSAHKSLLDGAILTADEGSSHVDLDAGSAWNMLGSSNVSSLRNAASTITFAAPDQASGFKTLTVKGDYSAQDGVIAINTELGSDDSKTDKVIINGNSSGTTSLLVNNAGGNGDYTYNNGIQVVQVDGASDGTFTLGNRVVAGANEYLLFQGGKGSPNDGDWYLRSEVPVQPPIEPPGRATC